MELADRRAAVLELNKAFVADIEAMSEEDWAKPSDCKGWSNTNLVVHLIQVMDLLSDSIARGVQGDAGPPPAAIEAGGIQAWRAQRMARNAEIAAMPKDEIVGLYREGMAKLEEQLAAVDGAPEGAQAWHPAGAQPVAWFVDQWLFELGLHDWDLRVSLDPAARLRESAVKAFVETLPARLPRGFSGADNAKLAGRYRIELNWGVTDVFAWVESVGGDGTMSYNLIDAWATDVTIRTDPTAFALVMTNRRPSRQFHEEQRWLMHGQPTMALGFVDAFQSY